MIGYIEILCIVILIVLGVQIFLLCQFVKDTRGMIQSFVDFQSEMYLTMELLIAEAGGIKK